MASVPLRVTVVAARNLVGKTDGKSSPYAEVHVLNKDGVALGRGFNKCSKTSAGNLNPQWNEQMEFAVPPAFGGVTVRVWAKHRFWSHKFLGQITLKFNPEKLAAEPVDQWIALGKRAEKDEVVAGDLHIRIQYGSASSSSSSLPAAAAAAAAAAAPTGVTIVAPPTTSNKDKPEREPLSRSKSWHNKDQELKHSAGAYVVIEDKPEEGAEDEEQAERQRTGPPSVSLSPENPSKINCTGTHNLSVSNNSSYQLEKAKANVRINGGCWYFEVTLTALTSQIQVGWMEEKPKGRQWSWDLGRQRLVEGETVHPNAYSDGDACVVGDVIGCGIDMEARRIFYFRNGRALPDAWSPVVAQKMTYSGRLLPFVGLGRGGSLSVNFGHQPFRYPQTGCAMLHSFLSEAHMDELLHVFNEYKGIGIKLSESGDTGDVIKGPGTLQFYEDVAINPETDVEALILAYLCRCETVWVFTREEWVNGLSQHQVHSVAQIKEALPRWKSAVLSNPEDFNRFYLFVFDHLRGEKKILLLEEAIMVWDLVFAPLKWPLYETWKKFLTETNKKSVTRDTHAQLKLFAKEYSSVATYDLADSSWPSIFDEFVEFAQAQK